MVGGGIFAVLGLSVQLTRGAAPIAFLIAGLVALVTSYSYTRLSVTFPNEGGTVAFLDNAFGPGLFTGTMNVLLWISYIVMLSLYSKKYEIA
jgi:amino acid transporter